MPIQRSRAISESYQINSLRMTSSGDLGALHRQIPRSSRWLGWVLFTLQTLFPNSVRLERLRERNALRAARNMKEGRHLEVDRRKDLSKDEFVREYLRK